jgi:ABC-type transporter Mla subunit MlaD
LTYDLADKYKEENWNLEVKIQDLQNQLSEARSNAQRAESETKRLNKQLATLRETFDAHKNGAERLAQALEDPKAKLEMDLAQMRKTQAGLNREKQDMQTALDALKADIAKKARTPGRFGSPMLRPRSSFRSCLLQCLILCLLCLFLFLFVTSVSYSIMYWYRCWLDTGLWLSCGYRDFFTNVVRT